MIELNKEQIYIMYIKNTRTGPPTGINVSIFQKKRRKKYNVGTYLMIYSCRKKLGQIDCFKFIFTSKYISYTTPVRLVHRLCEAIIISDEFHASWTLK